MQQEILGAFKHWQLVLDADNIFWLTIDRADEDNNTLGIAVMDEFDQVLALIEEKTSAKGLVLKSGKSNGFIYGADIREFGAFKTEQDVLEVTAKGHALFQRFEALALKKVVIIQGVCLGGGLELALCADYIIAQDRAQTKLGLPEVKLGIYPGLGGTVRLSRKIGGLKAMPLMLTGRMLGAKQARALGIVDQVISVHQNLDWSARKVIQKDRSSRHPTRLARFSNSTLVRHIAAPFMRKQTAAKANPEHYPSPFALIDLWQQHGGNWPRMLEAEQAGFAPLMVSPQAASLRRVFSLMEALKKHGKQVDYPVKRVHVIGAGVMGGDIAAWCVVQGMEVTLQDREMKYIEPALKRAKVLFKKKFKGQPTEIGAQARLIADPDGKGVERADVVIEAIYEDIDAKQALYRDLEPKMQAHAILATNTSSIPLETLSTALKEPSRLIGIHYFNPVSKMPLVEVIYQKETPSYWVDRGASFCQQIAKFPIAVKSSPGFLVNRVLAPYLMKALTLHLDGHSKEMIDQSATDFGMPMGPIELADIVGLDVCLKVAQSLGAEKAKREVDFLQPFINAGHLGKKSGQGLYLWKEGKVQKQSQKGESAKLDALTISLMTPFLAECVTCRDEGIVENDDLLDAGIIFGTGFAPFRGGPLHYLAQDHSINITHSSATKTQEVSS